VQPIREINPKADLVQDGRSVISQYKVSPGLGSLAKLGHVETLLLLRVKRVNFVPITRSGNLSATTDLSRGKPRQDCGIESIRAAPFYQSRHGHTDIGQGFTDCFLTRFPA
jgi:hypothetical protein